jgi:hypothetical protein
MSFSLADALRVREKERASKQGGIKEKAAEYAAVLRAKEAQQKRDAYVKEQALIAERNLEILREKERKRLEDERKTKRYFQVNKYGRKIPADGAPEYFGDMVEMFGAWLPHGKGQFSLNGEVIMKGEFRDGDFVEGEAKWSDGTKWEGKLVDRKMSGVGFATSADGVRREAMMREDVLVCYKDGTFPN